MNTIDNNLVNEEEDQKCDTCSYKKPCGTEYVINFLRRERGNLKSFKFPITLRGTFWYAVRLALGLITHLTHLNVNVACKS